MRKKADYLFAKETVYSFYKLLLIVVLVVYVVIFVVAYFYYEYDIRQIEASILANNIARCYISNGEADISNFKEIPSKKCNINAGEDYYSDVVFEEGFPDSSEELKDGGKNQEDVRIFCNVYTSSGERPRGPYKEGCVKNKFYFTLIEKEDEKLIRKPATILVEVGFKKRT